MSEDLIHVSLPVGSIGAASCSENAAGLWMTECILCVCRLVEEGVMYGIGYV